MSLLNEYKEIKSERRDLRNFGLVVGGVLAAIGLFLLYKERPAYPYLLYPGAGLFLLGLVFPRILLPLQKAWMALAITLGYIMTRLILIVLFYVILTPIAIMIKLGGKKLLFIDKDDKAGSYWIKREKDNDSNPEKYEKQF